MTPDEKKAKLLGKLNEEPKPILTQVVPVKESKRVGRPEKDKSQPTEHFNLYLPESLASDIRVYKARTRISIQDIAAEAIRTYLESKGALTIK